VDDRFDDRIGNSRSIRDMQRNTDKRTIQEKKWDEKWARERDTSYDDWLEKMNDTVTSIIEATRAPIIDLGCGNGNDTRYLLEHGKDVIPCDLSSVAIENIKKDFTQIKRAECFDMAKGLPFEDNFTDVIVSDLSLHYFSEEVTTKILEDIKRVLKPNGILILRVNSTNDTFWGAGQGEELEKHFYRDDKGFTKRYFDQDDLNRFFSEWEFILNPEEITLHRYDSHKEAKDRDAKAETPGKITWICVVKAKK